MVERTFTLRSGGGLHARPAALLVQAAQQFPETQIVLKKGEREASGRSLLSILALGAEAGDTLLVRCAGPREEEAMAAIAALLEGGRDGA